MLYNCSTLEKELITEIVKSSKLLSLRYQLLASTVHSGLEKLIQKYVKSAFYLKGARWRSMVAKKNLQSCTSLWEIGFPTLSL